MLLVRHAIAEERQDFAKTEKPDSERPLTREGREKMRRVARAAAAIVPDLDVIASSPFKRAMQTARILAAAYTDVEIVRVKSIEPGGDHDATIAWLQERSNLRCVAVVGHEPSLGELLTKLSLSNGPIIHSFKKGGMALVSFHGKPAAGEAKIEWIISPAVARLVSRQHKAT